MMRKGRPESVEEAGQKSKGKTGESQGRLHKDELVEDERIVLWLVMTNTDMMKDVSITSYGHG